MARRSSPVAAAGAALSVVVLSSRAPAAGTVEPGVSAPDGAVHGEGRTRDGFYLRITGGYGLLGLGVEGHDPNGEAVWALGGAFTHDLLIGGTPSRGLSIGGAILGSAAYSLPLRGDATPAYDTDVDLFVFGPFVDGFPNPREGLHVGAMAGLAWVRPSMVPNPDTTETRGLGAAVWAGYDWWAHDDWSAGLMLRLSGTVSWGDNEGNHVSARSLAGTGLVTVLVQ